MVQPTPSWGKGRMSRFEGCLDPGKPLCVISVTCRRGGTLQIAPMQPSLSPG